MHEVSELSGRIPWHGGNAQLALRFNQLTHRYPSPIWWLALGLLAVALRRPRGSAPLLVLTLLGAVVVVFTALALSTEVAYLIPFFPLLIVLTWAGLLGAGTRWLLPWRPGAAPSKAAARDSGPERR